MKELLQKTFVASLFILLGIPAKAQTSRLLALSNADGNLHVLDTATFSLINSTPINLSGYAVLKGTGISADPATGIYYAVVQESGGWRLLVTLDPVTSNASLIDTLTDALASISFDTQGQLYGVSGTAAVNPESLYKVNKANASLTLLGSIGEGMYGQALSYHPANANLYYSTYNPSAETILKKIDTTSFVPITIAVMDTLNGTPLKAESKGLALMSDGKFMFETSNGFYILDTLGNATFKNSTSLYKAITMAGCPVTVSITGTPYFCVGDSTQLTASAGADSYQWFLNGTALPNDTLQSLFVKSAGNYNVLYVTDLCNDTLTTGINVTQKTLPVVNLSGNPDYCIGDSTLLTGTVGGSSQWYLNGSPIAGAITNSNYAKVPGNYNMTKTNVFGCTDSSSTGISVIEHSKPTVTLSGAPDYCIGDSTLLTGTAGGSSQWYLNGSPIAGATSNSYYATVPGNYNMTKTNTFGCIDSSATGITAIERSKPTVTLSGGGLVCPNDSLLLSTSSTGSLQWLKNGLPISGATNDTLYANVAGIYNVIETNIYGCSDSASNGITVTSPSPSIAGLNYFCKGDSTLLTANAGGDFYQWYLNGNILSGEISQTIYADTGGVYNVYVTSVSCTFGDSLPIGVNITQKALPVVNLSGANAYCQNDSTLLTGTAGGSSQWYLNGSPIMGAISNTYYVSTPGNYNMTKTNGFGCTDSSSTGIAVSESPKPIVTLSGGGMVCPNDSFLLSTLSTGSLQWLQNGTAISGAINDTVYANGAGIYNVIETNIYGCSDSAAAGVTVTVFSPAITGISYFCKGDSTLLTANAGAGAYLWYFNGSSLPGQTSQTIYADTAGLYNVYVTPASCTNGDSLPTGINIAQKALPVVTISGNSSYCQNDSTLLTGTAGGSSQWYLNGSLITSATTNSYYATMPGIYNMTKTNLFGCTDSAATGKSVTELALPNTDLGNDTTICTTDSLVLDAGAGFASYIWNTSDNTQTITIPANTLASGNTYTYFASVSDVNSCGYTDTILVTASTCVGILELESSGFSIYPNPVENSININLQHPLPGSFVEVYNTLGGLILRKAVSGNNLVELNVKSLSNGIYFISIYSELHNTPKIKVIIGR